MQYRKLRGDGLFTGYQLLGAGNVLVVRGDGVVEDIIPEEEAGEGVETYNGILCPGFINAHCHLELSHMKGLIPERTGLVDFVFSVITQRNFPEEQIQQAIVTAEEEMLKSGIVAVGDISNNTSTLKQKKHSRLHYYNFIEALGWVPDVAGTSFDRANGAFLVFKELFPNTSIVPHAPYSVSDNLWQLLLPYFKGKVVSIHNQETVYEDEFFMTGKGEFARMYGKLNIDTSFFDPPKTSSLQHYYNNLADAERVILVHNTFIKQADIRAVKESAMGLKTFYCLCVNANLYIEHALPPLQLMMEEGCQMVVGTDSLASNHQLSILEELKSITAHFPEVSLEALLQWSTLNGAKALTMDDRLGSFEKGKQPGVVLISNLNAGRLQQDSVSERIL